MIEKNKDILVIVAIVVLIILVSLGVNNYNQNKTLESLRGELLRVNKPSEIENIKNDFDKNKKAVSNLKIELEKTKKSYEISVWKDRCLEKKLLNTNENCEKNLERFANYEQGLD